MTAVKEKTIRCNGIVRIVRYKMEGFGQGGKGGFEFIKVDGLAKAIGTSEPGLRFLIALLIGNY